MNVTFQELIRFKDLRHEDCFLNVYESVLHTAGEIWLAFILAARVGNVSTIALATAIFWVGVGYLKHIPCQFDTSTDGASLLFKHYTYPNCLGFLKSFNDKRKQRNNMFSFYTYTCSDFYWKHYYMCMSVWSDGETLVFKINSCPNACERHWTLVWSGDGTSLLSKFTLALMVLNGTSLLSTFTLALMVLNGTSLLSTFTLALMVLNGTSLLSKFTLALMVLKHTAWWWY